MCFEAYLVEVGFFYRCRCKGRDASHTYNLFCFFLFFGRLVMRPAV